MRMNLFCKALTTAIVLATAVVASATCSLTTPFTIAGPAGVVTAVSAPNLAAQQFSIVYVGNAISTVTVTYAFGTTTANGGIATAFTPAQGTPTIINTLNLQNGIWDAVVVGRGTIASGTVTPAGLTAMGSILASGTSPSLDAMDYFACTAASGGGFIPGVQSDKWAAGDL
jgi:hypothetical protein